MNEQQAKQLLTDILARFTVGSVLHLLAEVLKDSADELDEARAGLLRNATGTLFTVGLGIDSLWPGSGR